MSQESDPALLAGTPASAEACGGRCWVAGRDGLKWSRRRFPNMEGFSFQGSAGGKLPHPTVEQRRGHRYSRLASRDRVSLEDRAQKPLIYRARSHRGPTPGRLVANATSIVGRPVVNTHSQRPIQFGLRSLFVGVLILAVCSRNLSSLLELMHDWFYLFAFSFGITAWWVGQRIRCPSLDGDLPRTRFSILRVILPIVMLVCLLSLWLRLRWVASFFDDAWPRPFPYPDEIMMVFHDWLDSRYPASPGCIKLKGELYRVWLCLDVAAFTSCTVLGAVLGLVCRTNGPIGISSWHDRIVRMLRRAR